MYLTTTRRIVSTAVAAGVISLATVMPAAAEPEPGFPGSSGDPGQAPASTTEIREVFIDDGALEYLQIGLGALVGMGLAGVAAVGARRVTRHTPHLA